MKRPNRRQLIWTALPLLLIGGLLWAAPEFIRMGAEAWLRDQGLQAEIEDIDLNLFNGRAAIHGARVRNAEQRGLQLQNAAVTLRYAPLFSKRIHLSELQVQGLELDVTRNLSEDRPLEVAGIVIPAGEDETSEPGGWGFGLDKTHIDAATIRYSDPLLQQSITFKAGSVSDVATWAEGQPIRIDSTAKIAGGELHLQGQVQPFGEIIQSQMTIQAERLPLAAAAPLIPGEDIRLDGLLHADLEIQADYAAGTGVDLHVKGDSRLRQYQAGLARPTLDIGGDLIQWQGELLLKVPPQDNLQIESQGKLAASKLQVLERNSQTRLLELATLDIPALDVQALDNIQLNGLQLGAGHTLAVGKEKALVNWQSATAQSLAWQEGGLRLGPVQIDGLNALVERDAAGQWNIVQAITAALPVQGEQAASPETAAVSAKAGTGQAAPPSPTPLQLASLKLANSGLQISDASVEPALKIQLRDLALQLQNLDNQQPQQPSPLQIESGVGDYGKLELAGQIQPFATPPAADLQGKISGVDTVPLSGFTRKLVSHRIRQGTVSGDLDIKVENGRLDTTLDLVLNKLQIAAVEDQAGEFEKNSGMPLGTALNLLRDRDENIRLNLPITGALDKPDVNINDIIRQAIFKGVTTAALAFYSPLGIITAGDKLLQLATALHFDPIPFAPGKAEISAEASSQLATLTDTLIQRPALQISLCGIAVPADRQAIAEEIATENTRLFGLYRPEAEPGAVSKERLKSLARERMRAVGDYLSSHGIEPGRLILCGGEISDDAQAKPGVRLSL